MESERLNEVMERIKGNSNRDCGNPQESSRRGGESCACAYECTRGMDNRCESIIGAEKGECDSIDDTGREEHMKNARELAKTKKEQDRDEANQKTWAGRYPDVFSRQMTQASEIKRFNLELVRDAAIYHLSVKARKLDLDKRVIIPFTDIAFQDCQKKCADQFAKLGMCGQPKKT
jgi:hypothetical protein